MATGEVSARLNERIHKKEYTHAHAHTCANAVASIDDEFREMILFFIYIQLNPSSSKVVCVLCLLYLYFLYSMLKILLRLCLIVCIFGTFAIPCGTFFWLTTYATYI